MWHGNGCGFVIATHTEVILAEKSYSKNNQAKNLVCGLEIPGKALITTYGCGHSHIHWKLFWLLNLIKRPKTEIWNVISKLLGKYY